MSTSAKIFWVMMFALVGILVVFILIVLAMRISSGSNSVKKETTLKLEDLAKANTSVRIETTGQIEANEDHYYIISEVSQSQRSVKLFRGYNQDIIAEKSYPNNNSAYRDFLAALDRIGFLSVNKSYKGDGDFWGLCSSGERYRFIAEDNGKVISDTWTTSCKKIKGTSLAQGSVINSMFKRQLPDYGRVISQR